RPDPVPPGAVQTRATDESLNELMIAPMLLAGAPVRRCEHGGIFEPVAASYARAARAAVNRAQRALVAVTDQREARHRVGDDAEHRSIAVAVISLESDQR